MFDRRREQGGRDPFRGQIQHLTEVVFTNLGEVLNIAPNYITKGLLKELFVTF